MPIRTCARARRAQRRSSSGGPRPTGTCMVGRLFAQELVRITRAGIRYSNIDPDHEMSADPRPTGRSGTPEPEPVIGRHVPLAIARKLASRASEARRVRQEVGSSAPSRTRKGDRSRRASGPDRRGSQETPLLEELLSPVGDRL